MRTADFHYDLPPELIAQAPLPQRADSRLLVLDRARGALRGSAVRALPAWLAPGDLMVFNDTRVIPARVYGIKDTGGRVELLVERVEGTRARAQVRASKPLQPGREVRIGGAVARVAGRDGDFYDLDFDTDVASLLAREGQVPLPPYIRRPAGPADAQRYQTVFARHDGACAAPTAGLHFDQTLLEELAARGVERAFVTLHVGAGTFTPVRVEDVAAHRMHAERFSVDDGACARIEACRRRGARVVAVGTTVVRALETAAGTDGSIAPTSGETRAFIYPGYRFRAVDALFTNFHLPESTLLMLVCAFAGTQPVLAAYAHAVAQRYRFFSYGDAMLIA